MITNFYSNQLHSLTSFTKESDALELVELIMDSCREAALQGLYAARHYGTFTYADRAILHLINLGYKITIHPPQEEVQNGDEFDSFLNYYELIESEYVEVKIEEGCPVDNYYTKSGSVYAPASGLAQTGVTYYAKVDTFGELLDIDGIYEAGKYYFASGNNYTLDLSPSLTAGQKYSITASQYMGTYVPSTFYYLDNGDYVLDTSAEGQPGARYKLTVLPITLYENEDLYVVSNVNSGYVEVSWEEE